MGSHLAQAGNADVDSASQQPDAGAAERPASSGISAEAKAAAEEESRKRAENYEKAQQAQKRRMAEQAEAKARSEAKARTSTPPKQSLGLFQVRLSLCQRNRCQHHHLCLSMWLGS